jgi:hypothetical protein
LLFGAVIYASAANPPAIKTIAIVSANPQLTIQSDLDVTNQIQSATNLNKGNWVVLTNLVVTQSPYSFVDDGSPRASQRFYRVMQINPTNNPVPTDMSLIPAGSFQMGMLSMKAKFMRAPSIRFMLVSAFCRDKYEVRKAVWDDVKVWSAGHGYG